MRWLSFIGVILTSIALGVILSFFIYNGIDFNRIFWVIVLAAVDFVFFAAFVIFFIRKTKKIEKRLKKKSE